MKNKISMILSLVALTLMCSCTSDEKIITVAERVAKIVEDAANSSDNSIPTLADLLDAGIKNATENQAGYKREIALASPTPTTLSEIQEIVNLVNEDFEGVGSNNVLVWSDEFDTPGTPSVSNWTYDIGRGQSGWGNNELQYYTQNSNNVIVDDGKLKITARKEVYEGANYTSSRLKSQGKYSFTYGKVEVRAKLPGAAGTWPAIWMLGNNITEVGWPNCGEIDIMEQKGWDKSKISSALHNQSSYGNTQNVAEVSVSGSTSDFHIYGMNWTENKIEFSVDGTVFYTYNPESKTDENWPYKAHQFIILNIAMGGALGGTIPDDFTESTMEIDYVRVYR